MYNEKLYNEVLYNRENLIPSFIKVTVEGSGVSVMKEGFHIDQRINGIDMATIRVGPLTTQFVEKGDEVVIRDERIETNIFGGYVKDINLKFISPTKFVQECQVQGYAIILDESEIPQGGGTFYLGAYTETEILDGDYPILIYTNRGGPPNHIITLVEDANKASWEVSITDFRTNASTVRTILEALAKYTYTTTPGDDRTWYVDGDKQLHYYSQRFSEAASFGLSDSPDNSTTFDYQYGNFEYTIDDDDNERVILTCWNPGLHAGQLLEITNSALSWAAKSLLITNIQISIKGKLSDSDYALEYRLTLGSIPVPQITTKSILPALQLTQTTLSGNAVLNVPMLGADPSTGYEGQKYFNTTTATYRQYGSSGWEDEFSASSFATPSIVLGAAAAAGAAATVIRSDSTIAAFDATVPSTQAYGDSAAVGTAAFAARRDHKHAMPTHVATQQTQADFNPDRALDTVYQNTSGKVLVVSATIRDTVAAGSWDGYTGAANPPTIATARAASSAANEQDCITFFVPAAYYYAVYTTAGANKNLIFWTEWTIG